MTNPYLSIKKIKQDSSDPIFSIASQKFGELAADLKEEKLLKSYDISSDNDIKLSLKGPKEQQFSIYIYPGGEVFSRKINGIYETFETAYDQDEKLEVLDDLISEARSIMDGKIFSEEVYERNGRIVFRKIRYLDGSSESSSSVFAGRIRRYFGCKKKIIKP